VPRTTQAELARLILEQRFGAAQRLDVRVLCGVTGEPSELLAAGRLAEGLWADAGIVELPIPSLAERQGDVPLLAAAFLAQLNQEHRAARALSPETLARLEEQACPSNVRGLRDAVHRLFWAGEQPEPTSPEPAGEESDPFPLDLNQLKTELEVRYIREALVRTDANIAAAARLLGMKRPRLSQKIRELNIDIDRIRRRS
jgi:two-component system NtrC family response regulator